MTLIIFVVYSIAEKTYNELTFQLEGKLIREAVQVWPPTIVKMSTPRVIKF